MMARTCLSHSTSPRQLPGLIIVFFLALVVVWPGKTAAAKDQKTEPSRLGLSGSVVGPMNEPVAGAVISLVPSDGFSYFFHQELSPNMAVAESATGENGEFHLEFTGDESSRIGRQDLVMVVWAEGHVVQLSKVKPNRLFSDAPLEPIRLIRTVPLKIKLLDADGNPVVGAGVRLAAVGDNRVPWTVALKRPAHTTDSEGIAVLDGADPVTAQGLFIDHPRFGNQRVHSTIDESGMVVAQMREMFPVTVKLIRHASIPAQALANACFRCVSSSFNAEHGSVIEAAWAFVSADSQGQLQLPILPAGTFMIEMLSPDPENWGLTVDFQNLPIIGPDTKDQPIRIAFEPQTRWRAKVIDGESGNSLPDILTEVSITRQFKPVSDSNGMSTGKIWHFGMSWHVFDSRANWFLADAFTASADKPAENGELELKPFALSRNSAIKGMVVDSDGQPVPGARVDCESSMERFTRNEVVWTNRDGSFRLVNARDGTPVKLRARKDFDVSDLVSVEWGPGNPVSLELVDRPTVIPVGRIVDGQGQPVAGLPIRLVKGIIYTQEGYNRGERDPAALYESVPAIVTDSDGRFEAPPTIEIDSELAIQIDEIRCFEFQSPYIPLTQLSTDGGRVDLGEFRVERRTRIEPVEVFVRNGAGEPVPGAQVLMVGSLSGTGRGVTDEAGHLQLEIRGGVSVAAIRAAGHHVCFTGLNSGQRKLEVTLAPVSQPAPHRNSVRELPAGRFESAARKLFAGLDVPVAGKSTYYRQSLFMGCAAALDSDTVLKSLANEADPMAQEAAQMALYKLVATDPTEVSREEIANLGAEQRCSLTLSAGMATDDPQLREELFGEALVAARGMSGREFQLTMAHIARQFAIIGELELAKLVATEMWDGSDNLQSLLEAGTYKTNLGESRTVGVALALIDPEKSFRLIELTAIDQEMGYLKSSALLSTAMVDLPQAMDLLKEKFGGKLEPGGVTVWLRDLEGAGKQLAPTPELAKAIGPYIENPQTRAAFYLTHARLDDGENRAEFVEQAVRSLSHYQIRALDDYYMFHPVYVAFQGVKGFSTIPQDGLDQMVFETLWTLPDNFNTGRWKTVLAGAARVLAWVDRDLAKELLEPCLQDSGWWFTGRQLGFSRHPTFHSIAWIDPEWAAEFFEKAVAGPLRHSKLDQMELRAGLITELMAAASTLRKLEDPAVLPDKR